MSLGRSDPSTLGVLRTDITPMVLKAWRSLAAQRLAWACVAIAIAWVLGFGWWLQSRVLINHDVGWIVRSAGWLLDGKRFGSDIVDSNPPLIWFLSIPAAAVARAGWLSEVDAIRTYFWLICLGSLALSHRILRPLREGGGKIESASILLGLAIAFALLPQAAFGQREYLAFVFFVPYCLLIGGRIAHGVRVSLRLAVLTGVLAGVAIAFKPWLLAAPILVEIVYLLHTGDVRRAMRAETLALATTLFTYVVAVVVFTPDYFAVSVPLARDVYWMFGRKTLGFMWNRLLEGYEPLLLVGLILACCKSFSAYAQVLAAALLGFALNYFFQRKGFGYHLYPVTATSLILLIYASASGCKRILTTRIWSLWPQRLAVVCVVMLTVNGLFVIRTHADGALNWLTSSDARTSPMGKRRQILIERLASMTGGGAKRVYSFSTVPYPAYPTLNYVNALPANSQLCLYGYSAYLKRGVVTDAHKLREIERGMATQRDIVLREFLSAPPDIVLVNDIVPGPRDSGFDFIGHFSTDVRFAAEWRNYVELEPHGTVRIFARQN